MLTPKARTANDAITVRIVLYISRSRGRTLRHCAEVKNGPLTLRPALGSCYSATNQVRWRRTTPASRVHRCRSRGLPCFPQNGESSRGQSGGRVSPCPLPQLGGGAAHSSQRST